MPDSSTSSGVMLGILPKRYASRDLAGPALGRGPRATAPLPCSFLGATAGANVPNAGRATQFVFFRPRSPFAPFPSHHIAAGRRLGPRGPNPRVHRGSLFPEEAKAAEEDLETLALLRSEVVANTQTNEQRRETLLAYYRALSVVEGRFPVSKQGGHVNLPFTWTDVQHGNARW